MPPTIKVEIHSSQFPDQVRRELVECLRTGRVRHKFHYDTIKQAQKWQALHQACSPAQTDPECMAVYDRCFQTAAARVQGARALHVIGLGCGGGQKEARLLKFLQRSGGALGLIACDVSTPLVLTACQTVASNLPEVNYSAFVGDLLTADDFAERIENAIPPDAVRLVTFFGMMPNFEPDTILPRLARWVRSGDFLLLSANLAPGRNYAAGVQKVLPLYDNELTRDWLLTFLLDLGVERTDGDLRFVIEDCPKGSGLKRIAARFQFTRTRKIEFGAEQFSFDAGSVIQLFYSYRHTPERVRDLLHDHGLSVLDCCVTPSEEEGVFMCEPAYGSFEK